MHNLRELQAHFMQRVSTRIVRNAFMNLRWRADYCAGLQEMADKIVRDKKRVTVRSMINMWKKRLNNILSTRLENVDDFINTVGPQLMQVSIVQIEKCI